MISENIDEKDFKYQLPSDEWLIKRKRELEKFVAICKEKANLNEYEIEINYLLLHNVFIRVDERADYFKYFHSETKSMTISQGKEAALEAYWIYKYKPFRLKSIAQEEEFYSLYKCTINEVIAAMLIIFFLCAEETKLKKYFNENKINTLIYDMFNRDISKEAMIMYVESFLPAA